MIDIHTHILPEVDDGARSTAEALEIAEQAYKQGIESIIATPHYVNKNESLTAEVITQKVNRLQQKIDESELDISILPGAEVYIQQRLGRELEKGNICSLNKSRYILLELPFKKMPSYVNNVFYDLKVLGYTPVISHPERYNYILEDANLLYNWIKDGIYAQLNAGSLLGRYGARVKETAEILLKNRLVHLIGSDVHSPDGRTVCLKRGLDEIKKKTDSQMVNLFKNNAQAVIADENLNIPTPLYQKKKTFFGKIKNIIVF